MLFPALLLAACAPSLQPMGPVVAVPQVTDTAYVAPDGTPLPLRRWLPEAGRPEAVVLAVHGFNDYSNAFDGTGKWLSARGLAVYAYDQRGFGQTRRPGIWPGTDTLVADLEGAARAVRKLHPGVPLFLLGESMGGAVALAAVAGRVPPEAVLPGPEPKAEVAATPGSDTPGTSPDAAGVTGIRALVDGIILSAPAVWSLDTMPFYQRWALWLALNLVPGMHLTAPPELRIFPSDNIEMLRALGRDPLVIKSTRVDAVAGLTQLMSVALAAAPRLPGRPPALVLFGDNEQVIARKPVGMALASIPRTGNTVAVYPNGYHMLLRDLQAEVVLRDILAWIRNPDAPLPSGADQRTWTEKAPPSKQGPGQAPGRTPPGTGPAHPAAPQPVPPAIPRPASLPAAPDAAAPASPRTAGG
ncbi:MAG TPA: alpha/beta fold hydrolase [Azospirillaceae bacterium]|nr:alpha/beta fold hydrolase [Azospirillaceae bacterium]